MKNKFAKILGVFLTTAIVAGMLVSAMPVAAKAQDWEKITTPANNGQVDPRVNWVGPIERAIDGTLYCAVGLADDILTTPVERYEVVIYKSTDFGRTWEKTKAQPFPAAPVGATDWDHVITDILCSPVNANVLWVTDSFDIWRSNNGGDTWVKLRNLFEEIDNTNKPIASGLIVSMDVGYRGSEAVIYVATSTFNRIPGNGVGANLAVSPTPGPGIGGVYSLSSYSNSNWVNENVNLGRTAADRFTSCDVLEVKVLPNFADDQGIVAVVSDYSYDQKATTPAYGRTIVTTKYGSDFWGEQYGDATLKYSVTGGTDYVDDILLSATIWLPSDFATQRRLFVGVAPQNDESQGDVFRCFISTSSSCTDLGVEGVRKGLAVTDMDGVGGWRDADILVAGYEVGGIVPQTWATQDGGSSWAINDKRPTGGISPLYRRPFASVRVHANFASNGLAVVGTHGRNRDFFDPNGDAGLSVSYLPTDVCDKGFTWNTIYFISTWIHQKVDMSIANDNTIYMTTYAELKAGEGYEPGNPLTPNANDVQLYSVWRYMDTTGDGVRDWERVNSYSLYEEAGELFHFDFVRTTAGNSFVVLVDRCNGELFYSTNRGNKWEQGDLNFPTDTIYSVLLVADYSIMVGAKDGKVYFSDGLAEWELRKAFGSSSVGPVTDLRLASNKDVIAAAVGTHTPTTLGKVFVSRSVYSATNSDYSSWPSSAMNTGVNVYDWAFAAPADDYATSNVISVTSDISAGVFHRVYSNSATTVMDDEHSDWYWVLGAYGSFIDAQITDERYLSNLVTAPGKPGFTAEGNGMTYVNAYGDVVEGTTPGEVVLVDLAVARVKGRVDIDDTRAAERIDYPVANNNPVTLQGLWAGPASVGSVILYAFGKDCNIWFYEDTLNQPITGVEITSIDRWLEECAICDNLFQATVKWNALANVTHYLLIVTTEPQEDNFYDAVDRIADGDAGVDYVLASIQPASKTAAVLPGLNSQKTYYVSVWGFKYTAGTTLTGGEAVMAQKVRGDAISSFGAGTNFTTPALDPSVAAPAAGAQNVSIRPAFQWAPVVGATSYTLTVSDNPNFTSPIKSVTTTATAYGWTVSDPVLDYSTTYYWRVVATTASGSSMGQGVNVFTTESAPPPPPATPTLTVVVPTAPVPSAVIPTITVVVPTQSAVQPTIIVTNPPQPTQPTPFYIWIIVAVGAILCIAVIVLIVRTRRVV